MRLDIAVSAAQRFDAFLIGLTATPSKQTFGFFHKNLVMEYPHARAVADGLLTGHAPGVPTFFTPARFV